MSIQTPISGLRGRRLLVLILKQKREIKIAFICSMRTRRSHRL